MHQPESPLVAQHPESRATALLIQRRVYVIDEDRVTRRATVLWLRDYGFEPRPYVAPQDFLDDLYAIPAGCVLVGKLATEHGFLAVIGALGARLPQYPVIVSILPGDVASAVRAMKAGASDVIGQVMDHEALSGMLDAIFVTLAQRSTDGRAVQVAQDVLRRLPARELDILSGLVDGLSSKEIAVMLGLTTRTVELSRSKMMHRLNTRTLSEVLWLAFTADVVGLGERAPSQH